METQYSVRSIFALYAAFTAFLNLAKQFCHEFIPERIREYIDEKIKEWFSKRIILDPKIFTLVIKENFKHHGSNCTNDVYSACEADLTDKFRSLTNRLEGCRGKHDDEEPVSYYLTQNEEYVEFVSFDENHKNIELRWKFCDKSDDKGERRNKSFELTFDSQYKDMVLDIFIPLVVVKSYDKMREMKKQIFLHTYNGTLFGHWNEVSFNHPFTFDALALDPELKKSIVEDLDRFIRRKEFYKKIGRAWKRGYLLYGPPGTGKSSLIAAIANYLKFDIYDLQLSSIEKDSTLRNLMMSISNKSILVIEDIDCASGLSRNVALSRNHEDYGSDSDYATFDNDDARNTTKAPLSLSGLLNFIDGLWSSCGDERIIILTTNHKERLDPALLRPGRMDMHIHMSYLRMPGFRILAYNYLGLSEHPLFDEIEELLKRTDISPAEAAEELMRSEDPDIPLNGVVKMLKQKKRVRNKATKGKEDDSGSEPLAKEQKNGGDSMNHTEIVEDS